MGGKTSGVKPIVLPQEQDWDMKKTFLDRFLEYVNSPEGFNCVEFQYGGIPYQVSSGHLICYTDKKGKEYKFIFQKDMDILLDAKVLHDGKSLREVWSKYSEFELSPEFY